MALELKQQDKQHLVKFGRFCGYTGELQKPRYKKSPSSNNFYWTENIRINCGLEWVEDLKHNFAIVPKKTYNLCPPNIEDEYLIHCFVLGYIDGDGCVYISQHERKRKISLTITSASEKISLWLQEQLSLLVRNSSLRDRKRKKGLCSGFQRVSLCGNPACAAIDYFRQFPLPYLERKWNQPKVLQYIETQKQKHPEKFLQLKTPNKCI